MDFYDEQLWHTDISWKVKSYGLTLEILQTHELVNWTLQEVEARKQWQLLDACQLSYTVSATSGKNTKSLGFIFFIDNEKGSEELKINVFIVTKTYVIII